jgi:aryl-alcohol dehydrogenase-like predicted oxidoreductase
MKAEMQAGDRGMAASPVTVPAAAAGTVTIGGDGGLVANRMGFGAMRVTGPGAWGPPPDRTRAIRALRVAVDAGVNFIDTADSYGPGVSEEIIAEALFPYPDGLVLATKGGLARPGPGQWVPDGRPERLRECCEGSLRRLRLEQIPLYQLHRPDPAVPLAESVGVLAGLQREGKIGHIGVSNVSLEQLRVIRGLGVKVASVQNRYNAADRRSEEIVDLCEADGSVFLPWAPMQEAARLAPMAKAARRRTGAGRPCVAARQVAADPGNPRFWVAGTRHGQHRCRRAAAGFEAAYGGGRACCFRNGGSGSSRPRLRAGA